MSDWGDLGFGEDWSAWTPSDFTAPGVDWTSGYDLGGQTGGGDPWVLNDPTSFTVGQGQIPSEVYQYLLQYGGLQPGFSTYMPGSGGGGGGMLGSLAKALGLGNNASSLLPLLASIAGGALNYNSTKNATNQMQDAITKSNEIVQQTLGGNKGLYEPFVQAGLGALPKLQNFNSNLSANFKPLGSGRGLTLGQLAGGRR